MLGLIVNPVAGLGGRVGRKGSDGAGVQARALALGAVPAAEAAAVRALTRIAARGVAIPIATAGGGMGEAAARSAGLDARVIAPSTPPTSAADTRAAAMALREAGVSLLLFAGGDGTARDVLAAVGASVPVLGIPAGVKMQSAVFATSPEAAGDLAARVLERPEAIHWREAEVLDLDEDALRHGRIEPRLFGYARTPHEPRLVQAPKARGGGSDADLDAACAEVAAEMPAGVVHLIGPGTTTRRVLAHLGLEGTLLGIDAVLDGRLAGTDLGEAGILLLAGDKPVRIVLGVAGGQGFLLGRGNQPLSPPVLRQAGRDGLVVLASQEKLAGLESGCLFADTGDAATDRMLAGFLRVRTGHSRFMLMRVSTPSIPD